jgi:hypothetical protein
MFGMLFCRVLFGAFGRDKLHIMLLHSAAEIKNQSGIAKRRRLTQSQGCSQNRRFSLSDIPQSGAAEEQDQFRKTIFGKKLLPINCGHFYSQVVELTRTPRFKENLTLAFGV